MNAVTHRGKALSDADLGKVHGGGVQEVLTSVGTEAYAGYKIGSKFGKPGKIVGTVVGGLVGLGTGLFA